MALSLSLAAQPAAGDFSLAMPVDCVLDDTCYIQQFMDHDPTSGYSDFMCGSLSYDTHKGTDFALSSLMAQAEGVAVLAAADGEVRGVRNHMPDILQGSPDAPDVSDTACGNGVVLRHANGWETQYCHLAQGTVTVNIGDQVRTGDTLGMIGLSGRTQFPHLHLSVRQNGKAVDPFDPDGDITCGAQSDDTLWSTPLTTPAGGIITSGFASDLPAYAAIKAGTAGLTSLPNDAPAMVLWGYGFGTQAGDIMTLRITGPEGEIFATDDHLDRQQAQMFRAGGKRTPAGGWPAGEYIGTVILTRNGAVIDRYETQTTVFP